MALPHAAECRLYAAACPARAVWLTPEHGLRSYSDHTTGTEAAVAAVAMGACCIEKHFTIDKTMEGPDHQASLEPAELAVGDRTGAPEH